jgi:hypothetical protein
MNGLNILTGKNTDDRCSDYACSSCMRCCRRAARWRSILLVIDGFSNAVRRLNSFKMPARSYFFLKRRSARSIGSCSWTIMPTKCCFPLYE